MVEMQVVKDQNGNPVPMIKKISPEQYELLKMLNDSGSWHLYRQILNQAMNGLFYAALAEDSPHKMAKLAGQVAGMNFAINQLGVLLEQQKQQAKRVENETKNSPHAEG